MIESIESVMKRLRSQERWPFHDAETGCHILEDRYYGFGDSGSMWTKFEGHETADDAIAEIKKLWDDGYPKSWDIGTTPEQLGDSVVTVLKGRDFVDRLYVIYDYRLDHFQEIYGHECWVGKCETA